METNKTHPRTVVGSVAIRELRWLRRHAPESAHHCNDIEASINREVRRGIDGERRAARSAKETAHNADNPAA